MNIKAERIRENFERDLYWTRIYFESVNRKHMSTVVTCASWEYIIDTNRINEVKDLHLNQWIEKVIKKWKSLGNEIFKKKIHYDVYASTAEGKINGLEFLKKKDIAGN